MSTFLFRVSRKDLEVDYFRAGGKGGQKQNKTSSGCRIRHAASGAVGESREERSQHANRKIAFRRLTESRRFQNWVKAQAAAVLQGHRDMEDKVKKSMSSNNLNVEYVASYTCDGCGKKETVTSYAPGILPNNWMELEDDNHYCGKCAENI
jgi:protein subunit release factor B